MKTERIILSFIAVLIGLLVAGAAFYFYQTTKVISTPPEKITTTKLSPTETTDSGTFLTLDTPKDEEVVDKRVITVAGKTTSDALILVSTETSDEVVKPSSNGSFSLSQTIAQGANVIVVTAISPTGEERRLFRTVTFSTESF